MADFKTHMTVSTATGAALAFVGYQAGMNWATCAVAGTLCSVSGMLPDLDSDSGRPLREATALSAAVVPMLMVERLQRLQLNHDTMVLIAIASYLAIRFLMAEAFRRYTVHRGMWHSLPAAATSGMLAFLIVSSEDLGVRIYKTSAVVLGFLSHLILDEVWSVDFKRGSYRFKSSFGTALKLWGNNRTASIGAYTILLLFSFLVYQDQGYMARFHNNPHVPHTFGELYATIKNRLDRMRQAQDPSIINSNLDGSLIPGAQSNSPAMESAALPSLQPNLQPNIQPGIPAGNWPPPPTQGWQ
jgi:hypothetical protein